MKPVGLWVFALAAAFGIGLQMGGWSPFPKAAPLTCRPSVPQHLPPGPAILFWGNSIAFDHGWSVDGSHSVNCAIQGLTAENAVAMTGRLPRRDFSAIVLAFGSVELARGAPDIARFAAALSEITKTLRTNYPDADLIVLGVPAGGADPLAWRYAGHEAHAQISAALRGAAEPDGFVDVALALNQKPLIKSTYDGIHMTTEAYARIEKALWDVLQLR